MKLHRIGLEIDIILNNMWYYCGRYSIDKNSVLTTIFDDDDDDSYLGIYIDDFYRKLHYPKTDEINSIIISKIKKKLGKKDNCVINIVYDEEYKDSER